MPISYHSISSIILSGVLLVSCLGSKVSGGEEQRVQEQPMVDGSAGAAPPSVESKPSISQTGMASWYGGSFVGRRTASGESYDIKERTAAHRTLPFGTYVRVTNLRNKKSAIVRINNRGPYRRGRIIDLSRQAASDLGMLKAGTARVQMEVLIKATALAELAALEVSDQGERWAENDTGRSW